ncbi:MAG TPA: FHA domain-containing protein, partial [bacterium]|nr:FHA domain-containing protein [bacterium]
RIYIKDSYRLNRRDGKLLSFDRASSQQAGINESVRFWVDIARRDHPKEKFGDASGHLQKFLGDLNRLPKPGAKSSAFKDLFAETLPGLHRPLPPNSKALFDENFEVFVPVRDSIQDLGLLMKFRSPQTGLTLQREGGKFILGLQLVLDNDADPTLEAETNGRIYLNDVYEIDAASGKVLKATRGFTPSKVGSGAFDKASERLAALNPLDPNLPALQKLTAGWLEGLGAIEPKVVDDKKFDEPSDAYGKALWRLHQATGEGPKPDDFLLPRKNGSKLSSGSGLPRDPERRLALRRALEAMLAGDGPALEKAANTEEVDPILQSLLHLWRQETTAAKQALSTLPREDALGRRIQELIDLQSRTRRLEEGLPLLELALQERFQRRNNEDRAWVKTLGRTFSGESAVNPEMRRVAVDGYIRRLRGALESGRAGIHEAILNLEGDGPFEKEVKALLRGDPAFRELTQVLDENDEELRRAGLVHLARRTLKEENKMPATALAIAERYAATDSKAAALRDWLTGQGSFGQKFESALGHFSHEVLNPFTLGTMMLAGGASKIGKFAFIRHFGNSSLGLRIGAEAFSVGVEATAFLGSDKLYRSMFQSPVGVWDRTHRDFAGTLLAFGVLRGGGIAGRRLQGSMRNSEAWQAWLQGRTQIAWATKPLQLATNWGKTEGRGAAAKQWAGNVVAVPLRYVAETGLPRAWLKPTTDALVSHGLTLGSLMTANSLSRWTGLRPGSAQGWKADLVDDALFYGHFYFSGKLLQKMGPSRVDFHLEALEKAGPQPGRPQAAKAEGPAESANEPVQGFELPPQLRDISSRFAKIWQSLRRQNPSASGETSASEAQAARRFDFRAWLQNWRQGLAGLRWPWSQTKAVPVPVPIQRPPGLPSSTILQLPPGAEKPPSPTRPVWADTIPPPAEPRLTESFLIPKPLELPLRFVPGKGKFYLAVSWTKNHDDRVMLPVSKNSANYECILGREGIQARPEAVGIDLGFPSNTQGMETQHAKITLQVKFKLEAIPDARDVIQTLGSPEKITATLENLSQSAGTYLNGKRVKSAALKPGDRIQFGKDGPSVLFHQASPDQAPTLTQGIVPLSPNRQFWTVGRESFKEGSPDIAFPMSSRDVSQKQARIVCDAEGNYYIQDLGRNSTLVNGKPVYGTQPLKNQDLIRFGEGQEFIFRSPEQPADRKSPDPSAKVAVHPRSEQAEPVQAERHPVFRDLKPEEVDNYFLRVGESDRLPLDDVRAGSLTTPDGRPLMMMTQHTGWTLGAPATHPSSIRLQFRETAQTEANPFHIYIDQTGDFVLKPLKPESSVFVQGRDLQSWLAEPPLPTGPKLKVEGWARLRGGERIFSGDDIYFDFMRFSPPKIHAVDLISERPTIEPPPSTPRPSPKTAAPEMATTPLLGMGAIPLKLQKSLVLQNEAAANQVEVRAEGEGLSVQIPPSLGSIGRTTIFQDGATWKIHSEGGKEAILVNGIPLPANIRLPLAPDSELSIGNLRFKVEFP